MAVIATAKRASAGLKIAAGTKSDGGTLYKSMSLTGLKQGADNDKLMNVVDLLSPCLESGMTVAEVTKTEVVTLDKE